MFSYQNTLNQVKKEVFQIFAKVPKRKHLWVHSFSHTARVVANCRRLLAEEASLLAPKMKLTGEKFTFLAELSAWCHDLGRILEDKPSFWKDGGFNHAEASVKMAEKILLDDRLWKIEDRGRKIEDGRWKNQSIFNPLSSTTTFYSLSSIVKYEDIKLVLQAIAEHNQPTPAHPRNLITRVLQDADRGDGFSYQGMVMVLNYNKVINTTQTETETESRKVFLEFLPSLLADAGRRQRAHHWLTYLSLWYTGGPALNRQCFNFVQHCPEPAEGQASGFTGRELVSPLYTQTAKKIFRPGFQLVQKYLEISQKAKNREDHIIKIEN